jgi:hypothetical protein
MQSNSEGQITALPGTRFRYTDHNDAVSEVEKLYAIKTIFVGQFFTIIKCEGPVINVMDVTYSIQGHTPIIALPVRTLSLITSSGYRGRSAIRSQLSK